MNFDISSWNINLGTAIITAGFVFFVSVLVESWIRIEELEIELNLRTKQNALDRLNVICYGAGIIVMILVAVVLGAYILTSSNNTPQLQTGNETLTCQNCTLSTTYIVNNYNISSHSICEHNKNPTIDELRYLMNPHRNLI
jgi:hypothetical protein